MLMPKAHLIKNTNLVGYSNKQVVNFSIYDVNGNQQGERILIKS